MWADREALRGWDCACVAAQHLRGMLDGSSAGYMTRFADSVWAEAVFRNGFQDADLYLQQAAACREDNAWAMHPWPDQEAR
jgi:hypothetical protein